MKTPKKPFYKKPSDDVISEYTKTLITPNKVVSTDVSDITTKDGYTVTAKDLDAWKAQGMDWGSTKALADWYDTLPQQPKKDIRYGFGTPTQRNNPNRQMTPQEWELVKKTFITDTNNRSRMSVDDMASQGRDINNPIEPYNTFINENIAQIDEFLKKHRTKKLSPSVLASLSKVSSVGK